MPKIFKKPVVTIPRFYVTGNSGDTLIDGPKKEKNLAIVSIIGNTHYVGDDFSKILKQASETYEKNLFLIVSWPQFYNVIADDQIETDNQYFPISKTMFDILSVVSPKYIDSAIINSLKIDEEWWIKKVDDAHKKVKNLLDEWFKKNENFLIDFLNGYANKSEKPCMKSFISQDSKGKITEFNLMAHLFGANCKFMTGETWLKRYSSDLSLTSILDKYRKNEKLLEETAKTAFKYAQSKAKNNDLNTFTYTVHFIYSLFFLITEWPYTIIGGVKAKFDVISYAGEIPSACAAVYEHFISPSDKVKLPWRKIKFDACDVKVIKKVLPFIPKEENEMRSLIDNLLGKNILEIAKEMENIDQKKLMDAISRLIKAKQELQKLKLGHISKPLAISLSEDYSYDDMKDDLISNLCNSPTFKIK